jgi:integrase
VILIRKDGIGNNQLQKAIERRFEIINFNKKSSLGRINFLMKELLSYLKRIKIKRGRVFPELSKELDQLVNQYFKKLRVKGKFSQHSLRHTAGQIMYDKNIPIELIQKTLRHADMRTTMIYAQKAIDRSYFKKLKRF